MITRGTLFFAVQLNFILFVPWSTSSLLPFGLPEVSSYAKVSRNGNHNMTTLQQSNQARAYQDITISRSPVYVPSKSTKLRNGEAIDHPSTVKYSTLDQVAVAKLDSSSSRQKAQDRFHPPASFEHTIAHANAVRQQSSPPASSGTSSASTNLAFPVPSYATLPRDVYSPNYSFETDSKGINDSPPLSSSGDYSPDSGDSFSKVPDSYQQPGIYQSELGKDSPKFSDFTSSTSHDNKYPPKSVGFSGTYDHPPFVDDPYLSQHNHHHHHHLHDDNDYPHELIYDHPPDDHFHDHVTTTTEEPEMNDQRLSKRPYSYYYIGKKLWYLPLYFSIYFIFYIAALVLKSITRHKINFPASLAAVAAGNARHEKNWEGPSWLGLTKKVLDGIDAYNSIGKT